MFFYYYFIFDPCGPFVILSVVMVVTGNGGVVHGIWDTGYKHSQHPAVFMFLVSLVKPAMASGSRT